MKKLTIRREIPVTKTIETAETVETEVRLKLVRTDDRIITLSAVDADGRVVPGGYLLDIYSDGKFRRIECVNPGLGFDLNEQGRIKLAGED